MSAEYWSPAAELTWFMKETQRRGNQIAGNIAVGTEFHGEAWVVSQLRELNAQAEANAEELAKTHGFLKQHGMLPKVMYEGQLGTWLGVQTAPDNNYSLYTKHDGVQRELALASVALVDARKDVASTQAAAVFGRGPRPVYVMLGSILFPQPSPKGTIL